MLDELRLRIVNGCRPDLLELVLIRGVGRVRARQMAKYGIRTVDVGGSHTTSEFMDQFRRNLDLQQEVYQVKANA